LSTKGAPCPDFHQSRWIAERNHGNEWLGIKKNVRKTDNGFQVKLEKNFTSQVADYAN
jgi:hypothetical protein